MSSYVLFPNTSIPLYDLKNSMTDSSKHLTDDECRRICDQHGDCIAYEFTPMFVGKCEGVLLNRPFTTCKLKTTGDVPGVYTPNTMLYVKNGGKNHFWVAAFVMVAIIIMWFSFAKK